MIAFVWAVSTPLILSVSTFLQRSTWTYLNRWNRQIWKLCLGPVLFPIRWAQYSSLLKRLSCLIVKLILCLIYQLAWMPAQLWAGYSLLMPRELPLRFSSLLILFWASSFSASLQMVCIVFAYHYSVLAAISCSEYLGLITQN